MKTLIIYDEQGKVVFTNTNEGVTENEFKPLVVTIPQGKMLIGVNIETGDPIFSDIPKNEIEELKEQLSYQQEVSAELEAGIMDIALALEQVIGGNE